jgi:hypothetical protein
MTESNNADKETQSGYHVQGGTYRNTATRQQSEFAAPFQLTSLKQT